jgi:hypothetical protein
MATTNVTSGTISTTGATTMPTTTTSAPPPTGDAILLTPPPPGTAVPQPPAGWVPTTHFASGAFPRKGELAALPGAISELDQSTDYEQVFGLTGIPLSHVVEVLDLARQWSVMHNASDAWDRYARVQEGMAWTEVRALTDKMKMAFDLASLANPTITTRYMNLKSFLGYAKANAQKGASTRAANAKATAKGQPAAHGASGKQRKKAAEKAAYVAAQAHAAAPPATNPVTPPHS